MLPCVQIESLNEKNLVRTAAVYGPSGAPGPSLMHSFIICLFGGENYVARQTMHIFRSVSQRHSILPAVIY